MTIIFSLTVAILQAMAGATGLTYNEINIIVWYMVLPFLYLALLDRIWRKHILKIGFVLGWVITLGVVRDFDTLSDDLFRRSVEFLRLFSAVGLDYMAASVVVCLVLPGAAFVALVWLAFPSLAARLRSGFGRKRRTA